MLQKISRLAVPVLLFFSTSYVKASEKCPLLASANVDQLISYLNTPRNNIADFECSYLAISKLGALKDPRAIEILSQYLSYREPPTDAEKLHVVINIRTPRDIYPASEALISIGKTSLPALLAAIQSPTTELLRQNAIYTIIKIFGKEDVAGVKFIRDAALHVQDTEKRTRLNQAATESVQWCHFSSIEKCRQVLYKDGIN